MSLQWVSDWIQGHISREPVTFTGAESSIRRGYWDSMGWVKVELSPLDGALGRISITCCTHQPWLNLSDLRVAALNQRDPGALPETFSPARCWLSGKSSSCQFELPIPIGMSIGLGAGFHSPNNHKAQLFGGALWR